MLPHKRIRFVSDEMNDSAIRTTTPRTSTMISKLGALIIVAWS